MLSDDLRGFGPLGILAILVIVLAGHVSVGGMAVLPVGGLLALLWVRLSRTPWREIGYVRPTSWIRTVAIGVLLGVALKFLTKIIILPLLGAPPTNETYGFLVGNRAMLPVAVWGMCVVGGFGEETVFRGFAFERLGKLFGSSVAALTSIVVLTSAGFALLHYADQGLPGVEQAAITGLVFGTIFAVSRRIWIPMIAHAAYDLTALAIIYLNLESDVAHLVFK